MCAVDGTTSTFAPANGYAFTVGQSTAITCTATDDATNAATALLSVVLSAPPPPELKGVPAAVTAEAAYTDGAIVTYATPTAESADAGCVSAAQRRALLGWAACLLGAAPPPQDHAWHIRGCTRGCIMANLCARPLTLPHCLVPPHPTPPTPAGSLGCGVHPRLRQPLCPGLHPRDLHCVQPGSGQRQPDPGLCHLHRDRCVSGGG